MLFESPTITWATVALTLAILELFIPGVYIIWFGFAALVVSGVVYFSAIEFTTQLILFALFSAFFAIIGLYVYRYLFNKLKTPAQYANLNDMASQYIGNTVTLIEDVSNNQTKVKVGDTVWLALCSKELKAGDKAKITSVKDDLILIIE